MEWKKKADKAAAVLILIVGLAAAAAMAGSGIVLYSAYGESNAGSGTDKADEVAEDGKEKEEQEMQLLRMQDSIYLGVAGSTTTDKKKSKSEADGEDETEYIIADSDSRYLTKADLEGLTKDELKRARNEIYARNGRGFDDDDLQEYFNKKSWYTQEYSPEEFDGYGRTLLNDYEYENTLFILDYEEEMGYR